MNKIIITIVLLAVGYLSQAQVIITEETDPVPTNNSVLMEFGTANKGIILPSVDSAPGAVGGTFIVNTTDKAVQFYDGTAWISLTDVGELLEHNFINTYKAKNEEGEMVDVTADIGAGAIIGAATTTKPGILVLESTNQALVMPRVANPHLNILSPVAGTVVYDTVSDMMAVYDGKNWSYWAAKGSGQAGGSVASINCSASLSPAPMEEAASYAGSFTVSYEGGNGGSYPAQTLISSPAGFTATLVAGNFNNGSGSVTYNVTAATVPSAGNYSFSISLGGQTCTKTFTVLSEIVVPTNPSGTGSLSGRTCFDVVETNFSAECGTESSRLPQKADFNQIATNTQTYTFRPTGTVSNVRFMYVNTNGQVVQSITPNADYSSNLTSAQTATATVVYFNDLNATAAGKSREEALTADIYVIYNNGSNGSGSDVQLKLTVNVQDCVCCGAYVAAGVWKNFMCHNLGARLEADPFTPSWELNGAYIQWGKRGPNITGNSSIDWQTAPSNGGMGFAAAPTGPLAAQANSGSISGWSQWDASNKAWNSGTDAAPRKTSNDPCPVGYRVPVLNEILGLQANNTNSNVGTWSTSSSTNYTTGAKIGYALFLPTTGERHPSTGALRDRGYYGDYWTSSEYSVYGRKVAIGYGPTFYPNEGGEGARRIGMAIRCIQE